MIYAWYFAPNDNRLAHGDGREIKLGVTHIVMGKLVIGKNGLHASKRILDAVGYASGSIAYRVGLSGETIENSDKICARERTYIAGGVGVGKILYNFNADCAIDVFRYWSPSGIVHEYLRTKDESKLDSARRAAYNTTLFTSAGAAARAAVGVSKCDNPEEQLNAYNAKLEAMVCAAINYDMSKEDENDIRMVLCS